MSTRIDEIKEIVALAPSDPFPLYGLAMEYRNSGDFAEAAATFVRILPKRRVGYYSGRSRDADVDVLCASVQTLAKAEHLERFTPQHFDYVVIDEFHHAAAGTRSAGRLRSVE